MEEEGERGPEDGHLLVRIHVPELNVQKCLQFPRDQLVWDVKQQCLAALPKVTSFPLIFRVLHSNWKWNEREFNKKSNRDRKTGLLVHFLYISSLINRKNRNVHFPARIRHHNKLPPISYTKWNNEIIFLCCELCLINGFATEQIVSLCIGIQIVVIGKRLCL